MTLKDINPQKFIESVRQQMAADAHLSPGIAAAIDLLIILCVLLLERLPKNSKNSSLPPSHAMTILRLISATTMSTPFATQLLRH